MDGLKRFCILLLAAASPIGLAHSLSAQTISIPDGKVGTAFTYEIKMEGGIPPYVFQLQSGTLPPGLQLDGSSGKITGTPSGTQRDAWVFSVDIKDNSSPAQELQQGFQLKVAAAPMRVVTSGTMRVVSSSAPPILPVKAVDPPPAQGDANAPPQQPAPRQSAATPKPKPDPPPDCASTCGFSDNRGSWRAILGFEQVGASGTPSSQNYLFDSFTTWPTFNRIVRWWGDVKVGSFPQQVNSSLVTFEPQFASTFGGLKINQLAQNAEFVTGPEFLITPNPSRYQLSLFAGGGAVGPNNPTDAVTVFALPTSGTQAYTAFVNEFGAIPTPTTALKYVAFLPQSSDRFQRQWQAGIRLYTFYDESSNFVGKLPGTLEFSVGQNELVSGGHLRGLVGHVAATLPVTLGTADKKVAVYFFGEATNAYAHATYSPAIPLAPALSNTSPVPLTDPGVYTITVPPNHRDTYRIGVGMDLISVIDSMFIKSSRQQPPQQQPAPVK